MPVSKKFESYNKREWYSLRSILGNDWAMFYFLLGGREAGKSYATTKFFVSQYKKYGRPFYWLRLTDTSANKLLQNNAEKLIDPDIRRAFNLDITTSGSNVYEVKRDSKGTIKSKKLMARVLALSTYYNDKGSGLFDKDFLNDPNMYYNICLDEMNRERSERKTFDILNAFTNQLENLVRSTKKRLRIICIGNTLDEASDLMVGLNFVPEEFGRYYLKKKRAVIDYIPLNEAYIDRRKGTVADILMPTASTFTNRIDTDRSQLTDQKLHKPNRIIKFGKDKNMWFVEWDGGVIAEYNGEQVKNDIHMIPYDDGRFTAKDRDVVITRFLVRGYMFHNMICYKKFKKQIELIKPNGK